VAASLKRQGVKSGVPDVLIFAPIQAAIELKRKSGGSVSANQRKWLDALSNAGWETYIARGADKAIEWLVEKVEKAANEKGG
jgi:pyruvate/2-oxoacid:ferredoxin oxidoreductase beta subunit